MKYVGRSTNWTFLFCFLCSSIFYSSELWAQDKKSSDAAISQYGVAVGFQNRKLYDFAVDEWKALLEKYPEDPLASKAQHYLGICYFQLQKYPEAEAAFNKVIQDDPKFELLESTYINLGLAQFNRGQQGDKNSLKNSAETLKTLLEKYPKSDQAPVALYYRAEALYSLGQKKPSIAVYEQFIKDYPKHSLRPGAMYGLGVAQEEAKQVKAAGQTYETFLKENPEHGYATEVSMRRGETLMASKQYKEAEALLASAATTKGFSDADYALFRQAACRYETKKYGPAGDLYVQLVSQFPKSKYAQMATVSAGKCYFLAGDKQKTRTWLAKSQSLGGDTALEATHWLARSFLKDGKAQDALQAVQPMLAKADKSSWLPDLLMDQANAMYDIPAQRKKSVEIFARIAKQYPQHAEASQAAYMAAYASLSAGDYQAAIKYADEFLNTHKSHELEPDVLYVKAECYLQEKKYQAAEQAYQILVAKYPKRAELQSWIVRIALCRFLEDKHEEVAKWVELELPKLKDNNAIAEAQFLLGSSKFEQKKYDDAIGALQASLAANPQWKQADETMLILARAQREKKDTKQGIETLQKLIADFPKSDILDRAYFRLGEFQYAAANYAEAASAYEKTISGFSKSPLVPHALFGLGWSHLSRREYPPAVDAMSKIIDEHSGHKFVSRAHYARAVARQQTKEYSRAIEDVNAFLKSNPEGTEKSDALYVQGLCEAAIKKYGDAAKTFATILKESPKYPATDKVLYELAWAYQSQGKEAEAAKEFRRLAKEYAKSPLAAEAEYRVGEFEYQKKQYASAAGAYQAAVAKAGQGSLKEKAHHKLAWSNYQLKKYDAALEAFQSQLQKYPKGSLASDATVMEGECQFQLKNYEEALKTLQKARGMKPSSKDFEVITLLHAGQSANQLKKWEEGLALLEECSTKFPDSDYQYEVNYERAWALQNLKKSNDALKLFQEVADGTDSVVGARARFMVGEIFFLQKKYDEAIRSFFKVAYGYGYPKSPESYHVWQGNATFEAARCCENLKKVDVAKRLYKEVVEQYPKSDKVSAAKKKLASLGG